MIPLSFYKNVLVNAFRRAVISAVDPFYLISIKPLSSGVHSLSMLLRPWPIYALIAGIRGAMVSRAEIMMGSSTFTELRRRVRPLTLSRFLVRIPKNWKPLRDPRPVVFLHGLGLGLFQYHNFLSHLVQEFRDRPLLVVLQPHISQQIFHPKYLAPMPRKQTTKTLATLLASFDWTDFEPNTNANTSEEEGTHASVTQSRRRSGVTMLSHSK